MPTNEYEKAIEIAKEYLATTDYPDRYQPTHYDHTTIIKALLAMHTENKSECRKSYELSEYVQSLQADLKEALDVIRFYGDYKKNHCTVVTMNEFMEETEMHHGNAFKVDDGQRAREFLVKHEGKEKE